MHDETNDPGAMLALLCQRIEHISSGEIVRTRMGSGLMLRSDNRAALVERTGVHDYALRLLLLEPSDLTPLSQARFAPIPRHHARVRIVRWLDHGEDRPRLQDHLTPPEIWSDRIGIASRSMLRAWAMLRS